MKYLFPSSRIVIDIVFVVLVIIAISLSAVIIARAMTNTPTALQEQRCRNGELSKSAEEPRMIITDFDENRLPDSNRDPGLVEDQLYAVETAKESSNPLDNPVVSYIYETSPVILQIT